MIWVTRRIEVENIGQPLTLKKDHSKQATKNIETSLHTKVYDKYARLICKNLNFSTDIQIFANFAG